MGVNCLQCTPLAINTCLFIAIHIVFQFVLKIQFNLKLYCVVYLDMLAYTDFGAIYSCKFISWERQKGN